MGSPEGRGGKAKEIVHTTNGAIDDGFTDEWRRRRADAGLFAIRRH